MMASCFGFEILLQYALIVLARFKVPALNALFSITDNSAACIGAVIDNSFRS